MRYRDCRFAARPHVGRSGQSVSVPCPSWNLHPSLWRGLPEGVCAVECYRARRAGSRLGCIRSD